MARSHVLVILAGESVPEALREAIPLARVSAGFWPLNDAIRREVPVTADALVVVLPADARPALGAVRLLLNRLAEQPRAVLVMSGVGAAVPRLPHPRSVPVTFDAAPSARDLAVRLATLVAMRPSLEALRRGLATTRRNEESVTRRYAGQLRLASQVQREFLPETLSALGPVRFDLVFRPVDYVSGDIYDVQRLDEEHVGLALADASGHGIPAALLTVYIKRALRGKEIEQGTYRLLPPDEVLARLNTELLDAHLTECPFVAAAYAVLNLRTLELQLARGGTPLPLLRRADGEVVPLDCVGSVVGVLPDAHFECRSVQLAPGDAVLLYSDGLERVVAPQATPRLAPTGRMPTRACRSRAGAAVATPPPWPVETGPNPSGTAPGVTAPAVAASAFAPPPAGTAAALRRTRIAGAADWAAAHEVVTGSAWCETLRTQGVKAALEQLGNRQRTLRRMGCVLDDLTALALTVADETAG